MELFSATTVPASTISSTIGYPMGTTTVFDEMLSNNTSHMMDTPHLNMSMYDYEGNLTTPAPLEHQRYFSLPYKIVGCLVVSVTFVVGLIGNVMVVIVVSRTRSMHTTTNCYLVSLAVADILVLISGAIPTIYEYFLIIGQCAVGRVGCVLMVFIQYLGVNVSALSITAFTVERYIAICHPMRAQTMCTVRRAKRIIASLWLFGVIYCGPWLFVVTTVSKNFIDGTSIEMCTFKLEREDYVIIYMADIMIFYVAPLFLTCILYGLIARILFHSTVISHASGGTSQQNGNAQHRSNSISSSRVQVIKMLAVVVSLFAILWLPYRGWVVYNSFFPNGFMDLWYMLFARVMIYMNSAVNPILYNAMSVKFRRAFKRLLSCGKQREHCIYSHYTQVSHVNAGATQHIQQHITPDTNNVELK